MRPLLAALKQLGVNSFSTRENDKALLLYREEELMEITLQLMVLYQASLFQEI